MGRFLYKANEIFKTIFKLFCNGKINVADIEILIKMEVFSKDEEKHILNCLETIRVSGSISYEEYIKGNNCHLIKTENDISIFYEKPYLIHQIIELFIEQRTKNRIFDTYVRACERQRIGDKNEADNLFYQLEKIILRGKDNKDFYYLGAGYCEEKLDEVYSNIGNLYNKPEKGINFGNEIDKYFTGILPEKTLCIVGNNINVNRFFAIQLIYKALQQKKNICYVSLNSSKELRLLDFIAKNVLENNRLLTYEDIVNRKLKQEEFEKILKEFKTNYSLSLKVIDETDFIEFNEVYFRRVLSEVNSVFLKTTGKGIEIIVIDSIERLKLNTVKGNIHNETAIITHYLDLFTGLQKSLEFDKSSIVLLSEYTNSGKYTAITNDGNVELCDIKVGLSNYADIIVSVYNNINLLEELRDECKVKVLKDNNMPIMVEPITLKLNRRQFCFKKRKISLKGSSYNNLFSTKQAKAILDNCRKQKETKPN